MKQTKLISLLLVLCLVAALLAPGTVAMEAKAADGEENDGLVVDKKAVANEDGTYTITLEAYATGESYMSSTEKDVPTDIILVLDQSGSMGLNRMSTYSFKPYSTSGRWPKDNDDFYDLRHNGGSENLYYKLSEDSYASVSVVREQGISYNPIASDTSNFGYYYYYYSGNLYALVNDEYREVTVTRTGRWPNSREYTYSIEGVDEPFYSTSDYDVPDFSGIQMYTAIVDSDQNTYTYYYNDESGTQHVLGPYTGADSAPSGVTFYERTSSNDGPLRIDALKSAVTTFANSVYAKAAGSDQILGTEDDVDHRVAVVGFGSESGDGNNTELLSISGRNSGRVGVAYNSISGDDYVSVLQDVSTPNGQDMVNSAINALDANGATRADLGMKMAQGILAANRAPDGEERNRVVILFTDGSPTSFREFDSTVANSAISYSQAIKNGGAKVYSVGIFDGADATDKGNLDGNDTEKSNWFMQNVSSNGGTPQNPSFYLSAADAGTLNSIFQQIAGSIESGGTTVTLDENSVIRDVISPYFKLPDNATPEDISLSLVPCTGENQWGDSEEATGVTAGIEGTDRKNISVTGFDFSENWCGPRTVDGVKTYDGKKLVISFKVEAEPLFLGGNDVPTNASAGIYADSSAGEPVKVFPEPTVNVPIKEITVTAENKNVYLLGDVTNAQLMQNATVTAGTEADPDQITLYPGQSNYGLQPWQNEFVDIETTLTDKTGGALTDGFTDLKEDTAYNLTVTVSPKYEGTDSDGTVATVKTGEDDADVNVFKPEITWKDSEKNIGDVPNYEKDNFDSLNWIHATQTYAVDKMIGEVPNLSYTYDPEASALTKETPVKVTVAINGTDVTDFTSFKHEPCNVEGCKWDEYEDEYHFIVHVKSFDLTITKSGCNEELDPNQTFVFKVTGPKGFSMEVVIQGNGSTTITNLPAGDYTVTEDTGWSWRYEPSESSQTVTANSISDGKASVEFVNKRDDDHWLDGNAYCENVFEGITETTK